MKILFIHNVPRGNFGNADSDYMPATLAALGHEVKIVTPQGGDSSFLRGRGVEVVELGKGLNWFLGLRQQALGFQPHIVHSFIHLGCGLYPLIMQTKIKMKFVLGIRSPLLRKGISRFLVKVKNLLEPIMYDAITSHSIASAQTVIGQRWTINYVPPGIELDKIPEKVRQFKIDDPVKIIYIGSLRTLRNIPKMFEALRLVAEKASISVDIFGDGEDKERLLQMIQENNSQDWIQIKPIIPRNDLFKIMGNYDIGLSYVPKNLFDPAPPLKAIEYLASGLTVIATNTKGNELLIEDNVNGILVEESPESYAEGILRATNNIELRKKFNENARPSVEKYDWKNIVETQLLPVYTQLLSSKL